MRRHADGALTNPLPFLGMMHNYYKLSPILLAMLHQKATGRFLVSDETAPSSPVLPYSHST